MVKWKATSGNAYIMVPSPASDMAEVSKNLKSAITRAEDIAKLDKSSKEYQDGLTDLNDSMSSLYLYADDYWLRHQGLALYAISTIVAVGSWLVLIATIAFFFVNKKKNKTA